MRGDKKSIGALEANRLPTEKESEDKMATGVSKPLRDLIIGVEPEQSNVKSKIASALRDPIVIAEVIVVLLLTAIIAYAVYMIPALRVVLAVLGIPTLLSLTATCLYIRVSKHFESD